jgi:serine/threonine-protein kinase ULK4
MAPELFAEGATHSTASDLWSLGVVLYECAVGRPPFMSSCFSQLAAEVLHSEPAPIPGARMRRGAPDAGPGARPHFAAVTLRA